MNLKNTVILAAGVLMLASCSSSKTQLPYFTDLTASEGVLEQLDYNTQIKPDDELYITVSSTSFPEATAHYNLPLENPAKRDLLRQTTTPRQQTYIVNSEGDITMPVFGKIHVAGMTTEELQEKLTEMIQKDVADAVVRVDLINFRVVVAGEVTSPRTINVNRNRYSILDAISEAGDLTPYGERSNVLLIREENGQRVYTRLNLNSSEVLTSPYFYLKQNDYVYVEPNEIRQANSKYNQDNAYKLTVISTIVSAASVIASLVIALTIK